MAIEVAPVSWEGVLSTNESDLGKESEETLDALFVFLLTNTLNKGNQLAKDSENLLKILRVTQAVFKVTSALL